MHRRSVLGLSSAAAITTAFSGRMKPSEASAPPPHGLSVCATVKDLRAAPGQQPREFEQYVWLAGYHAPADGGGGLFFYDPGATGPDDGGTVLAPASGTGRWMRADAGPLHARWFGARFNVRAATGASAIAGSRVFAVPTTSMMAAGMDYFQEHAGRAGTSFHSRIEKVIDARRIQCRDAAASSATRSKIYYGFDDTGALLSAFSVLKKTGGALCLPSGICLLQKPVDLSASKAGVTVVGESKHATAILANTGGAIFDLCGASSAVFANLRMYTVSTLEDPATVGFLLARSEHARYAAYNEFSSIKVHLEHNENANSRRGSIGVYNFGAELVSFNACTIKADIPVVIANQNIYELRSSYAQMIEGSTSATQVDFSGACELSARRGGSCLVLSNCANVSMSNTFMTKKEESSPEPAIEVVGGLKGAEINVNLEKYSTVMRNTAPVYRMVIRANCYVREGEPFFDVQNRMNACDFLIFTSGRGSGEQNNYFRISKLGSVGNSDVTLWQGQDLGLPLGEGRGSGLRLRHEHFDRLEAQIALGGKSPVLLADDYQAIAYDLLASGATAYYDPGSGVFTAPVSTSYSVHVCHTFEVENSGCIELALFVNDGAREISRHGLSRGCNQLSSNWLVDLRSGERLQVRARLKREKSAGPSENVPLASAEGSVQRLRIGFA